MDLSSLITFATIVFSMFKIISGLKVFPETGPRPITRMLKLRTHLTPIFQSYAMHHWTIHVLYTEEQFITSNKLLRQVPKLVRMWHVGLSKKLISNWNYNDFQH